MDKMLTKPVTSNAAWTQSSLGDDDWTIDLTRPQIEALADASNHISGSGRLWHQTCRADFVLPEWTSLITSLQSTLEGGRGFARVRALPVSDISTESARLMLWGLGQHLGFPEPQDASGNLLHDVCDTGKRLDAGNVRAYQTNLPINYHNDGADAFVLLCYRAASSGGKSKLVSAVSVFNAILDRRPDIAGVLQKPFDFDARGQERPGSPPYQRVPIYTPFAGHLNTLYKRDYIELAQRFADVPRLTPLQIEALDLMDEVCNELALEFVMEPGDIIVANNYDILHGRSAFDNAETDAEPRHMLRLWLSLPNGRPLPPIFEQTREFYHSYTRRNTQTESHT
jgi:hypothetical protein